MRHIIFAMLIALFSAACTKQGPVDGSVERPLRVLLIPADGGTEQGTLADYEPLFKSLTERSGLHFQLRVAQSYNAVVEGMAAGQVDVAFFGPVSYMQAKKRNAAQLLAVAVEKGESVYYAALFARKDSGIAALSDLAGRSVAFGDVNSTSSFVMPVAMMMEAKVDPVQDLKRIIFAGSHSSALAALEAGKVDVAAASLNSYEKAVSNHTIDPQHVVIVAKSGPIPYPPLAMSTTLDESLKKRLRDALRSVHEGQVDPSMIKGYGGKQVDRYDVDYPEQKFDEAMDRLNLVTDDLKARLVAKASAQ